jgi:glucose/arabinose dehydrogenase
MSRVAAAAALALVLAGCGGAAPQTTETPRLPLGPPLRLERLLTGLDTPVQALALSGDRDRLYVVEQGGLVRVFDRGEPAPFLDLRARISAGGERGLFSIAFHPRYPTVPRVYASYTDRRGDSRVSEYELVDGRSRLARDLLHVEQPYDNHNGGQIVFGPDGRLYLGLGDGGDAFDPERRSQDGARSSASCCA